jgi:hypothetical protein
MVANEAGGVHPSLMKKTNHRRFFVDQSGTRLYLKKRKLSTSIPHMHSIEIVLGWESMVDLQVILAFLKGAESLGAALYEAYVDRQISRHLRREKRVVHFCYMHI